MGWPKGKPRKPKPVPPPEPADYLYAPINQVPQPMMRNRRRGQLTENKQ